MRTTLQVDDDVLAAARTLADEQGMSLGAAVSELARRGLRRPPAVGRAGLPVFEVPEGSPPITPAMVREAMDEP